MELITKNNYSESEQNKVALAYFSKYQELMKEYTASPDDNNLCGFVILNHRKEKNQTLSVSATQFGNLESMINTLIVSLCKVTEQCSIEQQINISKQISNIFENRAVTLESRNN